MEEQYKKTFDQMVDSLKMYQRYELKDKNRKDILDKVYVDPIENDGILNLCLKDNTTVLIGRRGTGKSTIFMRMQNELRKQNDIMTCYIDVKSIFDVAKRNYITINYLKTSNLEEIEQYSIQRQFILDFVDELINEICKNYDTIWEKFKQKLHISKSQKAIDKLKNIRKRIQDNNHLSNIEMQTLQEVMHSNVDNMSYCDKRSMKMDISLSKKKNILNAGGNRENTLSEGEENGKKYNRVFARIFEITSIVTEIKSILQELSMRRLFLILDDYSEIEQTSLVMFCDLIVNTLHNNSDNFVKLKISATDLNFTLCLNKEYDDKGQQKGDCFVVESLRDEDCFSKSRTAYTVTHIFSAPNDAKKYTNLLFLDENATIDGLPDEIKNMLDQTLLHK